MAQIQFKGKSIVWNHHLGVEYHELVPDKTKSLTDNISLKDNLIIHGDNLKALKALLPTYAGKVKCIYIDPPYNTGEEGWAYSDNISSPMIKEWLGKIVDKEDLTRHDKWLCMMTPRLKLLRELLSKDGTIFISIDYNENYHLRQLCNEIFGEEFFIGEIYWESKTKSQNTETSYNKLQPKAEVILVYGKQTKKRFNLISLGTKSYPEKDKVGKFRYFIIDQMSLTGVRGRESMVYAIKGVRPKEGFQWKLGLATINNYIARGDLILLKGKPSLKIRPEDERSETTEPFWGFFQKDIGTAETAKKELTEILGKHDFETVKPVALIKRLILHATNENDIILDSFSGSGTTAQAVMEMNKEDGGQRKFVLVEMEDYADKITAERVRRVIKGLPEAKDKNLQKGLVGSFSYFELGNAIDEVGILSGKKLPSYEQMARYLFYTATGEEFDEKQVDEDKNFIGKSKDYEVYLHYKPDVDYLKNTALNLEKAESLPAFSGKRRLIFAPAKYLDQDHLEKFQIDFAQLPFEIYKKVS